MKTENDIKEGASMSVVGTIGEDGELTQRPMTEDEYKATLEKIKLIEDGKAEQTKN